MTVAATTVDPHIGTGNWAAFDLPLETVMEAAADWKRMLDGVRKPWLCWSVSPRWCLLQQKLVQTVGWTPVVGFDPRAGQPPVVSGAVAIDFNARFGFPVMWPHFPLEFAFLFTERLAFWHADLLCRPAVMEGMATLFDSLRDGQMSAVLDKGGRRNYFNYRSHRFWELCGCTTKSASESQFYNGAGWWRNFALHPKCTLEDERARRRRYSYDSGVGILYWRNNYRGAAIPIDIRLVHEGHCSEIRNERYKTGPNHKTPWRDLSAELNANYSLDEVAQRLGIAHLL